MSRNQKVSNVVLACEGQDAHALVHSIQSVLAEKTLTAICAKKHAFSKTLLESKASKEDKDPYTQYESTVQEAIDYVVESILEGDLELENTIQMASKQYNVKEEQLKEYFRHLTGERTETEVDSTSSNDHDERGGVRDDEDTNKRVRYESATLSFDNGQTMVIREGIWENTIEPVLNQLNESNRAEFMKVLTKSRTSFLKALDFCHKVVNN